MKSANKQDNYIEVEYEDDSDYLEFSDGKEYMFYDLQTNEYKVTNPSKYDFFH